MQFDSHKIYVCTNLTAREDVQILIKIEGSDSLQWHDFHRFVTFPLEELNEYHDGSEDVIYILDDIHDLADFINGERNFPIFKTDEEEQREKEEAEKSQECNNREDKLKQLRGVLNNLFDDSLRKESSCPPTEICRGQDCSERAFDCRNCFMDYIQRIVA